MAKSRKSARYGIRDGNGVCRLPVYVAPTNGGAPKGNRNARYRQWRTEEGKAFATRVDALIARIKLTVAATDIEIARREAARMQRRD